MFKAINCATVTLLHKVTFGKDYRPIACSIMIYKIIAKFLTKRLQAVILKVVCEAQSRFIPGRVLADNVLLASELLRGYDRKYNSPKYLIKVDLRKAYDLLEWGFIEEMLAEMNFPRKFIYWIIVCVSSVSYAALLNCRPLDPFTAAIELRQGDPLSPFFFLKPWTICLGCWLISFQVPEG